MYYDLQIDDSMKEKIIDIDVSTVYKYTGLILWTIISIYITIIQLGLSQIISSYVISYIMIYISICMFILIKLVRDYNKQNYLIVLSKLNPNKLR